MSIVYSTKKGSIPGNRNKINGKSVRWDQKLSCFRKTKIGAPIEEIAAEFIFRFFSKKTTPRNIPF